METVSGIDACVHKEGKGRTRMVSCKFCDAIMTSSNRIRWESHMRMCKKAPEQMHLRFPIPTHRPKPSIDRPPAKRMMHEHNQGDKASISTFLNSGDGNIDKQKQISMQFPLNPMESMTFSVQACEEVRAYREDLGDLYYMALDFLADSSVARTFVVMAKDDRLGWLKWKLENVKPKLESE